MKILVNGGLNCSELDGWWAEAYSPEVGWAIGDGQEHGEDPGWDSRDANQLYDLLEREIVPEFYRREASGIPSAWITRMRESMARLTPQFSANRAVREYAEQHYLPLANAIADRMKDNGQAGAGIPEWRRQVEEHWPGLRLGGLSVSSNGGQHNFSAQVWLDELNADAVAVELYADGLANGAPERHAMTRGAALVGSENGYTWTANITTERPAGDFSARVIPRHPLARVPLECSAILWSR
jgi:starch phosphorylase